MSVEPIAADAEDTFCAVVPEKHEFTLAGGITSPNCGACEPECPVEAIFPEDALPSKWEPFVKINYACGDGLTTVDRLVEDYLDGDGGAGVREPRRPSPKSPERDDAIDPEN